MEFLRFLVWLEYLTPMAALLAAVALLVSVYAAVRLVETWRAGPQLRVQVYCMECGQTLLDAYPVTRAAGDALAEARGHALHEHQTHTRHKHWHASYQQW